MQIEESLFPNASLGSIRIVAFVPASTQFTSMKQHRQMDIFALLPKIDTKQIPLTLKGSSRINKLNKPVSFGMNKILQLLVSILVSSTTLEMYFHLVIYRE